MSRLDTFWIGVGYGGLFVIAVLSLFVLSDLDTSDRPPRGQVNPQGDESEQDER